MLIDVLLVCWIHLIAFSVLIQQNTIYGEDFGLYSYLIPTLQWLLLLPVLRSWFYYWLFIVYCCYYWLWCVCVSLFFLYSTLCLLLGLQLSCWERLLASCFTFIVSLMFLSCYCYLLYTHGTESWSWVWDCCIPLPYPLTFWESNFCRIKMQLCILWPLNYSSGEIFYTFILSECIINQSSNKSSVKSTVLI